jgi:hypothetical protein
VAFFFVAMTRMYHLVRKRWCAGHVSARHRQRRIG